MTKHPLDWSRCRYRNMILRRMRYLGFALAGLLLATLGAFLAMILKLP